MLGKFISIDGIEGSGKSTQIPFIEQYLSNQGIKTLTTYEPGGTNIGNQIRNILLKESNDMDIYTELLLMFAARNEHIQRIIKPALAKGIWVITDRFTDASYAYQGGGRGIAQDKIQVLDVLISKKFTPDISLFFDVPLKVVFERMNKRGNKDRFEQEGQEFFARVQELFLTKAQENPQRIKLINGNQSIAEVSFDVIEILKQFI